MAIARGAIGIVHLASKIEPQGVSAYGVSDTLQAYRLLAREWLRKWRTETRGSTLMVAGSVGKTSTKEMLAAILRGRFKKVLATQGSQNGFTGIPATLARLRPEHDVLVLEVGIDEIGAMTSHLEIVEPDLGLVTAIGPEHLENLKDVETVFREESFVLWNLVERKKALALNLSDPWLTTLCDPLKKSAGRVYTYALDSPEMAPDLHGELTNDLVLLSEGTEKFSLPLPLPGKHQAQNLLGAVGLARLMGLQFPEIEIGLQTFEAPPGRSSWSFHSSGAKLLLDYYNANPTSVAAALELLQAEARKIPEPRLLLLLGDMLELGTHEREYHEALAVPLERISREFPQTEIHLVGPKMKWLHDRIRSSHYPTSEELATVARTFPLNPRTLLLLKGSRGIRMERVLQGFSPA
jgi:UDP-N-acetylmuramoyl-tripeptide--D-alanyl-D-alanine ligase